MSKVQIDNRDVEIEFTGLGKLTKIGDLLTIEADHVTVKGSREKKSASAIDRLYDLRTNERQELLHRISTLEAKVEKLEETQNPTNEILKLQEEIKYWQGRADDTDKELLLRYSQVRELFSELDKQLCSKCGRNLKGAAFVPKGLLVPGENKLSMLKSKKGNHELLAYDDVIIPGQTDTIEMTDGFNRKRARVWFEFPGEGTSEELEY